MKLKLLIKFLKNILITYSINKYNFKGENSKLNKQKSNIKLLFNSFDEKNRKVSRHSTWGKSMFQIENIENISLIKIKLFEILENDYFKKFIKLLILSNSILLSIKVSRTSTVVIYEIVDFCFYIAFIIELLIKIYAFSPRFYFSLMINRINSLVLILIFIEYLYELFSNINIFNYGQKPLFSFVRVLKIIRILEVFSDFKYLSEIGYSIYKSFTKIEYFIFILSSIFLTFAVIGKYLFAYRIRFIRKNEIPEIWFFLKSFYLNLKQNQLL